LFCLARFRVQSMSRFSLLLFLLPATCGVAMGLRRGAMKRPTAIALAVAMTVLTIPALSVSGQPWWSPTQWMATIALGWPAWYLVKFASRVDVRKTG
jgi:hypothetical protein